MANEIESIGISMDTSGVERGIRSLDTLASKGPVVERSLAGVEGAAKDVGKSLDDLANKAPKAVDEVGKTATKTSDGLNKVTASADGAARSVKAIGTSTAGMEKLASASASSAASVKALGSAAASSEKGVQQFVRSVQSVAQSLAAEAKGLTDVRASVQAYSASHALATQSMQAFQQSVAASISAMTALASKANEIASIDVASRKAAGGVKDLQDASQGASLSLVSMAKSVVGLLAGGVVFREFVQAADAITTLDNRLKLATGSAGAAEQAYSSLYQIAQRSRVSFTELGSTYSSIARATGELGISQQRMLKVTESIANAMTISGGSAASMQAALVQLSQGMASGVLRGEELNSVMEQAPRLAKALADGLGVPIGRLREMGQAGEISAEKIVRALESQSSVLSKEVAGASLTVGQAFTQLSNASTNAVGEFDKATGASGALAKGISSVASAMDSMGDVFRKNEVVISGVMGALAGGAALASIAALPRAITAVTGAVTGLSLVLAANPAILALLGVGAVVGGGAAAFNSYKQTVSGIEQTNAALERQREIIERNLATDRLDADQRAANLATLEKINKQMRENRATLALAANKDLDTRAEDARLASNTAQYRENQRAQEELLSIKQKLSGVDKEYLPTLNKLFAQYQAGNITLREYQGLVAQLAQANYKPQKQNDAIKEQQKEMAAQAKLIAELSGLASDFYQDWDALSKAFANGTIKSVDELAAAQAKLLARQPAIKAAAEAAAKAAEEEAKAVAEAAKQYADLIESRWASVARVQEQVQKERDAAAAIGLTKTQVSELEAAKLDEAAASKERLANAADEVDLSGRLAKSYRDEAKALRDLAAAKRNTAARQESVDAAKAASDAAKKAAEDWQRYTDEINRALTDSLMRGFESGKGFAENMRDTIVNMFKTMVLRPVISAVLSPISGAVGGVINNALGGGAGGNGVLGLANNASSLYGLYNNAGSYLNTIGGWLGLGSGAAAAGATTVSTAAQLGAGFEAYMASQGVAASAGGTAAGAAAGGASAIPIIGWILAGIAASNAMYGKGYSINGVDKGIKMIDPAAGLTNLRYKTLGALGVSDKWADILSGGPLIDKTLDLLGISGGERRFGGQYGYSLDGTTAYNPRRDTTVAASGVGATFLEGPSGGMFAEDEVKKLINTTVEGINGIFGALESSAKITGFTAGLEVSTNDKGGVYAGGTLTGGIKFGEAGTGNPFESTSTRSPNAQKAIENFSLDMQQATIQALQAATDIPKSIQEYLKQFDAEKLTTEQVQDVLNTIGQQAAVIKDFRDALKQLPFENLKSLSYDAADALIKAAGGLDTLNTGLTGYYQNFYSEAEQTATLTASVTKAITDLGLTMPDLSQGADAARAQFRALVEGLDVTDEKQREQYIALLNLQGAFAQLTPVVDQVAEAAQRAQAALQERTRLEDQLLQLQGNTDELRRRELERLLTDENRSLQQQIWAQQDANAAAQAAAQAQAQAAAAYDAAAAAAQSAAQQIRETWKGIGDSLVEEIKRIRGEMVGTGTEGLAYYQSQFAIATAQARSGNQDAASSLPELSRQILDLSKESARSSLDLTVMQAQVAASLSETVKLLGRKYGITVPSLSVGTAYVPEDTLAQIHKGEAVIPAAFNPFSGGDAMGMQAVVEELRLVKEELQILRAITTDGTKSTVRMGKTVEDLSRNGFPVINQPGTGLATS